MPCWTGEGTPSGQMPSISTWSEKLRKGSVERDRSKDSDVESTATVLMISAATSNSSPSRTLRPKSIRTSQWTPKALIARDNKP